MDIKNLRRNYKKSSIDFDDIDENPISFFLKWFKEALIMNKGEANACVLSTVSKKNLPSSRVVLLKSVSENGFTFFTNYNSEKSLDIQTNPNVALNFYWPEIERQVRIKGKAKKIDTKDSDNYFKSRPRKSQIGSWISSQSTVMELDHSFIDTVSRLEIKFQGKKVERPSYWGGYCVAPVSVEFWQGRPSRLHDRLLYELDKERWLKKRLAP